MERSYKLEEMAIRLSGHKDKVWMDASLLRLILRNSVKHGGVRKDIFQGKQAEKNNIYLSIYII